MPGFYTIVPDYGAPCSKIQVNHILIQFQKIRVIYAAKQLVIRGVQTLNQIDPIRENAPLTIISSYTFRAYSNNYFESEITDSERSNFH